jgi:uncharacterized phage-like protein YoqJ
MTVLSVTGHRPHLLGGYHVQPRLDHLALVVLADLQPDRVCTGMALGWDQAVASACKLLGVPFVAVIPGFALASRQYGRWPAAAQAQYHRLLHAAAEVEQLPWPGAGREFHYRDMRLVERCDEMLALWNGDPSTGTGKTVRMCDDARKPILNVWSRW